MVADERDLPVGLVRGAVDPGARLAPEAADLVRRWGAEAAAEVLVEEQAHLVALDGQRIVVLALLELDVALAGLVVEGAVTWAAPRLASEVLDTRLLLRVAKANLVADGGGVARLLERREALELVADVLARVAGTDLGDVDDVAVVEVVELLGLCGVGLVAEDRLTRASDRLSVVALRLASLPNRRPLFRDGYSGDCPRGCNCRPLRRRWLH